MHDLVDLALDLQQFFQAEDWEFCFIGGLAVQHWGAPRVTVDVDVSLLTRFENEASYIEKLLARYASRVPDAATFALTHRVLLLKDAAGTGIDIALAGLPFEESAVRRSADVEILPHKRIRLCSAEDLIVYKSFAARDRDWADVASVVARQGKEAIDWAYVFVQLTPLVEVKGEPEILARLRGMAGES